jgi:hypothetical protein
MIDSNMAQHYSLVDNRTGEVFPAEILIKRSDKAYWEKSYAKTLAAYFELSNNSATTVLTYLLKKKNSDNIIISTYDKTSEETGVGRRTVASIYKKIQEKGFMKKVSNGVYMLSPNLMRHGNKIKGIILFNCWEGL